MGNTQNRKWRKTTGVGAGSLTGRVEELDPSTRGPNAQVKHTGSQDASLLKPFENWHLYPGA